MDQSIEEYKTLRSELLRNFEAMERNLIACITANGVALAYGIKESQQMVLLLAVLIPGYFWIQHSNHRNSVAKIAAYISVFLESQESNLQWETRNHALTSTIHFSRLSYLLRRFLLPYPLLLILSAVIFGLDALPADAPMWLVFTTLCGAAGLPLLIAMRADISYSKLRKPWIEAFRERQKQERSGSCALAEASSVP